MSRQPDLNRQSNLPSQDEVSRRRLVASVVAATAFVGATAEAAAQTPAAGALPQLRFLDPPTSFKNPSFSHAVEAKLPGRIVYIAGQQGLDINHKVVGAPGDFIAQAEQAFLNIKGALAAAGGGFEHVIKINHYFLDLHAHFRLLRDIRLKYFNPSHQPASTMIQVGALTEDGVIYEVDVVAVLPPA